jgi:hypothetical protein
VLAQAGAQEGMKQVYELTVQKYEDQISNF